MATLKTTWDVSVSVNDTRIYVPFGAAVTGFLAWKSLRVVPRITGSVLAARLIAGMLGVVTVVQVVQK